MNSQDENSPLLEFLEQVGPSRWIDELKTREEAAGLCIRAALWTVASLEVLGIANELVCLTRNGNFHYVVKVDDKAIDLTSRQFPEETDSPRICAYELICSEWPDEPQIVDLDNGNTRYMHEIPDNWRDIASVDPPGSIPGWPYGSEWPNPPLTEAETEEWKRGHTP